MRAATDEPAVLDWQCCHTDHNKEDNNMTTTIAETITKDQAIALMERAVEEKGADYVYPEEIRTNLSCRYFESDGAPSCIVGHALSYLGMTLEGIGGEGENEVGVCRLALDLEPDALTAFERAQSQQDQGVAWGDALEYAKTGRW